MPESMEKWFGGLACAPPSAVALLMAFLCAKALRLEARFCVEGSVAGAAAAAAGDMRHVGIGVDSEGKKAGGSGSPFP